MIRKKIQMIQDEVDRQGMLVATSRALQGYTQAVIDHNENIKVQAGELKHNIGVTLPLFNIPTR